LPRLGGMRMMFMRPVGTMVLVGMWLGGLSACSSALLNAPVSKSANGWGITLGQAKEGPDEYAGDVGSVFAGTGEKLIWALVTVKNDGPQEETFDYDSCLLEGKGESRQILVVDKHGEVLAPAERAEAIAPGQERTRQLIYSYPKDQRPTRMKCGAIVLPIPAPR